MSLDVYLMAEIPVKRSGTGVFVRDNGKTRELSIEEIKEKWPESDVEIQHYESESVFEANITHNLGNMAAEAGIYHALWRPEEIDCAKAKDLISILEIGLKRLKDNPEQFKKLNPENGWGDYEALVDFVDGYLEACKDYPEANIEVSR